MLKIAERHSLAGDAIFFDPKGDRAAPGEITNGFADMRLRDVDMRDENLDGAAVLPLMKGPRGLLPQPQALLSSHKKGSALFPPPPHQQQQQRVERKAFGVLANTPCGEDPVGKKDVFLLPKKPSGGFAQEAAGAAAHVVFGKTLKRENRHCNPAAPASIRPASAAAVDVAAVDSPRAAPKALHHHHHHHHQRGPAAKQAAEDAEDKENQPPPKALPGVDAKHDRGRDGEAFEKAETTICRLREHAEKEHDEAAGSDTGGGVFWPMPLEEAKSKAIPGVRFCQGVLGELSVVDLYSTGERVSVPSKGLLLSTDDAGGAGSAVPHMMTERGRAEVKAYLSEAAPPVFRDPDAGGGDGEDVTENQLVDMFLNLHFGDDWLECDTVITRPPRGAGPHCFADGTHQHHHPPAQDAADLHCGRPAKRYCASSPDLDVGPKAADSSAPSSERAQQQQQAPAAMGPPPVPIRRDAAAAAPAAASASAACRSRPIPIRHKGPRESDFLRFREPPPASSEARSFVSESEGDDDPCRSFESVSTQHGTYGTSGHEQQLVALDGLHIGRLSYSPSPSPSSSSACFPAGKRDPTAAAGAGLLRGDSDKEN